MIRNTFFFLFLLVQYGTSFHLSHKWIFFLEMIKQWLLVYNHHHRSLNGFCGVYLYGEAKATACIAGRNGLLPTIRGAITIYNVKYT